MPFLRLARDQRGYETTFLLHVARPGERPRVLYWYRSAPGVRVGRPALDEDAIRTIEEQHPEIEFDWPHILEVSAAAIVELEPRPDRGARGRFDVDRQRRKPPRGRDPAAPAASAEELEEPPVDRPRIPLQAVPMDAKTLDEAVDDLAPEPPVRAHDILSELVGRDIATRLRARYAEINARIHQLPLDDASRAAWHVRAEPLNPDSWITPDEILQGVSRADELFDNLRRALLSSP